MDAEIKQLATLWKWCMGNLLPGTRWRFVGPTADDAVVVLVVHNIHWDQSLSRFEIEFETLSVIGPDGTERQAAPTREVTLPDWFAACQVGPTPLFMPSTVFKEYVDAERITNLVPGQA